MWFKKKDDFEFDAYETDKGAIIKVVLIIAFIIIAIPGGVYIGYNQYQVYQEGKNESQNQTTDILKIIGNITSSDKDTNEINVSFDNFNVTVKENPEGIYYYSTQEKVIGERCFIGKNKKDCRALTNEVCAEKECKKEVITETQCFVNSEKIKCPE